MQAESGGKHTRPGPAGPVCSGLPVGIEVLKGLPIARTLDMAKQKLSYPSRGISHAHSYRVAARGQCCVCDQWASPLPLPLTVAGVYCGRCCPVRAEVGAGAVGNVIETHRRFRRLVSARSCSASRERRGSQGVGASDSLDQHRRRLSIEWIQCEPTLT